MKMSRCVGVSFFFFFCYWPICLFEERKKQSCRSTMPVLTRLYFYSSFDTGMVKWKLVTILFLLIISLTYLTSKLKLNINYLTNHQRENLIPTLVFIHIQKTAGSAFERAIVRRLYFQSQPSCQCPINRIKRPNIKLRCNCTINNQPWLISRFSVGWLCGVHADWMHYHRCLPAKMNFEYGFNKRKYVFLTTIISCYACSYSRESC